MKRLIFCALLFCSTAYVSAMESDADDKIETNDNVTLDILNLADTDGRNISIELLISDHLNPKNALDEEEVKKLKEGLATLSVEDYNQKVIVELGIIKGKKHKNRRELVGALFAIVDQLEKQNKKMKSSGKTEFKAYEQQVKTATRSTYAAIITGSFAAVSVLFNILQGAGAFE